MMWHHQRVSVNFCIRVHIEVPHILNRASRLAFGNSRVRFPGPPNVVSLRFILSLPLLQVLIIGQLPVTGERMCGEYMYLLAYRHDTT